MVVVYRIVYAKHTQEFDQTILALLHWQLPLLQFDLGTTWSEALPGLHLNPERRLPACTTVPSELNDMQSCEK